MEYLWTILGSVIGAIVSSIYFYYKSTTGTLRIDHSNPEKDTYRFEIDGIDNLSKKKKIIVKIDHNADLSQR